MDKDQIIQLRNHHLKQGRNNDRRPIYPITKAECIIGDVGGGVEKVATLPEKGEEGKIYYNTTNKQYYRYHEGSGFSTMGLEDPIPTPFDGIFNIVLASEPDKKYENGQLVPKTNINNNEISVGDVLGTKLNMNHLVKPVIDSYSKARRTIFTYMLMLLVSNEKESISIFSQYDGCVYTIALASANDTQYFYIKDVQHYNGQIYNIEGITYKFVKVPFAMNGVNNLNVPMAEYNVGYIWTPKIINTEYHRQIVESSRIAEDDKTVAKVYLGPVHSKIIEGTDIIIFGLSDQEVNKSNYASYILYEPVYRLVPITGRFTAKSSDLTLKYPTNYLRLLDEDISFSVSQEYEYTIYDGVISITACSSVDNPLEDHIISAGSENTLSRQTTIRGIYPLEIDGEVYDVTHITEAMYETKFGQLGTDKSIYRVFSINREYVSELARYLKEDCNITTIKNIKFSIQISNILGDMLPIQETEVSPSAFDDLYDTGDIDTIDWPFDVIYPQDLFQIGSHIVIDTLNDDYMQTNHKVHIVIDIDGTSISLGGDSIDKTVHVELNNDTQLINNDYYYSTGDDSTPIGDR